ncbi:MAG TPA: hypothetical protein PKJ63_06745 [Cyclobacteriaceae bacterium]|nr:hypothetical protein [Cyclobacteriaceae bacterium]
MKLQKLTIKNFMPYKGEASLRFPTDEVRNTLIVFGDNMRGKTSLLNSIRWTFYNYAYGRHLRPIPLHLMPNRESAAEGDWTMEVRVEFEAGGSQYDLRRVAEKKALVSKPERPEDFTVTVHMKKDGAAIPASEIDTEINRFAPEKVSRFFLFDGELLQEYEELLIEGSDQGRKIKEAVEQALGVPALTNGRDDLYTILKRAQKLQEQEAAKVKGMEGIAERQREWYVKRESYETDLRELRIRHNDVRDQRLELEDDLERYEAVFQQKIELDALERKRDEIDQEIKTKSQSRLDLASKVWRDLLAPRLIAMRDASVEEQKRLMVQMNSRIQIETKIEQILDFLRNAVCPTCKQPMEAGKRESRETDLQKLKSELDDIADVSQNLSEISVHIQNISKLLGDGVSARILDIDIDLARREHELSRVENKIEELKDEIKGYDTDEIMRKRKSRDLLQKDETRLSLDIEDREAKIAEADRELKALSQRMTDDVSKSSTKGTQMAKLSEALYDSFCQSIEELRSALRQQVQAKASDAFRQMSTQQAYQGLQINENYGLKIIDHNGEEVAVRSAGAEQIVALSLIDGLSRSGRAAGPVVMDTPFGRLDMKHRKNILVYLPKSASQIVLFVHDGEIRGNDDLSSIAHRIGGQYEIREVSPNHSSLEIRR